MQQYVKQVKMKGNILMRTHLLTHYQLVSLTESKLTKKPHDVKKKRKILALRILDSLSSITDDMRANVLTQHELAALKNANRLRRQSEKY